ncbi:MAG: glycoside hydrolase family 2 protein [Oscillospiraceae bacterium]|nr:glycoside hydrolase family 2 protein [Oscillospiraceae bacterium]
MKISLAGLWRLHSPRFSELPVTVPGSVLTALLEHRMIEDPFYRENEAAARAWLYDDYTFSKTFRLTPPQLAATNYLCLDGIDTVAEVELNGRHIASLRDFHIPKRICLDNAALSEENELRIHFTSPYRYIEDYPDEGLFETYAVTQEKSPCIRKPNYMLGWDWAPDLADMGIARDVSILSTKLGYLEDFRHTCTFREDGSAQIDIELNVNRLCSGIIRAELSLNDNEAPYFDAQTAPLTEHASLSFRIKRPKRWNPVGFGEPTLYDLDFTLTGEDGENQRYHYRIGLREVEVDHSKDAIGTDFSVRINGKKVFLAGASYIPEDSLLPRITPERTRSLLEKVRDFGHNTVRVWGGGYYPTDDFYDFCDENGILVWQDLMFACACYNVYDEDFRNLIVEETTANVKRFRHHASVVIIAGDNECEDGVNGHAPERMEVYRVMNDEILTPLVQSLTDTYFIRTSPRSAERFQHQNDLEHYDTHYWRVWGDELPIEDYETICPRMLSEVGHGSFPALETIRTFAQEDEMSVASATMLHHQKRPGCNDRILKYVEAQYGTPRTFEDAVYLSQLTQAEAMRLCAEQLRRNRDVCNGMLYWQLNDCWPGITWSSVDYSGRLKALHYVSKRFFAPHLVSIADRGAELEVFACNDSPEDATYLLSAQVMRFDGTVLWEHAATVDTEAGSSRAAFRVPAPTEKDAVIFASLSLPDGTLLSQNFRQLKKDRDISYPIPQYTVEKLDDCRFAVTADVFTKYVYLRDDKTDAVFSDNFFTLRRNETKIIRTDRPVDPKTLQITSVNQICPPEA